MEGSCLPWIGKPTASHALRTYSIDKTLSP